MKWLRAIYLTMFPNTIFNLPPGNSLDVKLETHRLHASFIWPEFDMLDLGGTVI